MMAERYARAKQFKRGQSTNPALHGSDASFAIPGARSPATMSSKRVAARRADQIRSSSASVAGSSIPSTRRRSSASLRERQTRSTSSK
jgi:hypothetical protein